MIKVYKHTDPEYKRLAKVAEILTIGSPTGTVFTVAETYFDFGQDWKWTTILADSPKHGSYQALSPRTHEEILTTDNLFDTIASMTHDKYWLDKKED